MNTSTHRGMTRPLRGIVALAVLVLGGSAFANGDPDALRADALDALANIVLVEKDAPEAVRDAAAELLGRYGGPEHTAVVLQRLEAAPTNASKVTAIRALGRLGDATVIPILHALLVAPETHRTAEDIRWSVAAAAGDALLALGDRGVDVVLDASRGSDAQIRRRAVQAMARSSRFDTANAFTRFADDEDRWVRLATASILGALGDATAVPALKELLDDPEADVRIEAAQSLARLGSAAGTELVERLKNSESDRALALRLLARVDPAQHLAALLDHLRQPATEGELDDVAALLAACEPDDVVPALAKACTDESPHLRASAALLLGRLNAREYAETLISLLRDPSWDVQAAAATALARVGTRHAVPALRALAERLTRRGADARSRPAREACAIALSELGDPDSAVPLCLLELGERKRIDAPPEVVAAVDGETLERILIESVRQPDPGAPIEQLTSELRALELSGSAAGGLVIEELLRERPYAKSYALDMPEVWAALLDALGGCAGPAAAKTAATYANSERPLVRLAACRAILRLTTMRASKGD
jgi:HEAT repeat protein